MDHAPDTASGLTPTRHSIWEDDLRELVFPALTADTEVDVAIIGGGITGITCAALLAQAGRRVAVLEAARVGYGTTGHSTGNLYASVDQYLHKLEEKWGADTAFIVARSRRMGIDLVERQVRDKGISCQFQRQPWVLYSSDASAQSDDIIEHEFQAVERAGLRARVSGDLPFPGEIRKALVVSDQAQFHPLAYVRGVAAAIWSEQCGIFENTPVVDVDEAQGIIRTPWHTVRAANIVMATHTPKGFNTLQTGLGPYREYAVAGSLAEVQLAGGIFWSVGAEKLSTRLVEVAGRPYVLMIGEMHKTGQNEDPLAAYRKLEQTLRARFDVRTVDYLWSAQQYRSADGLPYIGRSIGSDHVYIATGFGADGLTYGSLAGFILSEQIAGRRTEFDDLYSPRRFTPLKSAGKFLRENLNVAGYYVKDYIGGAQAKQLADVARGEGKVIQLGGDKLAVYRDDNGALHAVSPVCTHLKCIVHWNSAERSWDCPCHGSRFSTDGEVIEGPALTPLTKRDVPDTAS